MGSLRKSLFGVGLLLLFSCFCACKVSDDAVAAAQQMTATATALTSYYAAIADSLTDTIALNELDATLSKIPFDSAERKPIEETRSEILKRKDLAQSLAKLASAMTRLSGSTAPADVQTAAASLGSELVSVKALPGGSPVPDALGKAGNLLLQLIQQRKEKKAAQAMDQTLVAVVALFEKEKPAYDSIARTHLFQASQVAADLISRKAVDPTSTLTPALKPLGLTALQPDPQLQETLRQLELARLQSTAQDSTQHEIEASAAMLSALQEMSSRVHLLATEKPMPIRGNPFSLKTVESWASSMI